MNTTQQPPNDGLTGSSLLPCPFCGRQPSDDLVDTLYPTGTEWIDKPNRLRSYVGHGQGAKSGSTWGYVWCLCCNESEGGCGAEVRADSRDQVVIVWNRRPATADRVPLPQNEQQAVGMACVASMWLKEHAPHRLRSPLTAAQPALTDEEILSVLDSHGIEVDPSLALSIVRAVK